MNDAMMAFQALAQPTRLAAFRQLVAACPDAIPAGEIAAACGVPHNTMSAHLATLAQAGLIRSDRQGRSILYRADLDTVRALVLFLTRDCCAGRPDICSPVLAALTDPCCTPEKAS